MMERAVQGRRYRFKTNEIQLRPGDFYPHIGLLLPTSILSLVFIIFVSISFLLFAHQFTETEFLNFTPEVGSVHPALLLACCQDCAICFLSEYYFLLMQYVQWRFNAALFFYVNLFNLGMIILNTIWIYFMVILLKFLFHVQTKINRYLIIIIGKVPIFHLINDCVYTIIMSCLGLGLLEEIFIVKEGREKVLK